MVHVNECDMSNYFNHILQIKLIILIDNFEFSFNIFRFIKLRSCIVIIRHDSESLQSLKLNEFDVVTIFFLNYV